jgi:inosine/xanthosine triphosphatase
MKILVGSENPVKLEAVKESFEHYFNPIDVIGFKVASGVPDQPVEYETYIGAENRAEELAKINKRENLDADFFVGIEGGIIQQYKRWFAFGAMCIIHKSGKKSFGTSAHFELPEIVTSKLLDGHELGTVMDEIMNQENTKQKGGAISFFTDGKMDRKQLYIPGLISALVPFNHNAMYFGE